MLFLLCTLGEERYAIEVTRIVEVLPLLRMREIPHAPRSVPGVFSYRGTLVSAIDLSELILGRPAERRLSTRLVLVRDSGAGESPVPALLGLITERATETMHLDPALFTCGVGVQGAPYLGLLAHTPQGFIQRIITDNLISGVERQALLEQAAVGS